MVIIKALKGNIIYAAESDKLKEFKNSYIVIDNGLVEGIYKELPERLINTEVVDYKDSLIIPGFNDLHTHAPQWENAGNGYSMQLLEWLDNYTFPVEAKFADIDYAIEKYNIFTDDLKKNGTLRSCIFATIHKESTLELMKQISKKELKCYVGKVNMDRNSVKELNENTQKSISDTLEWIERAKVYSNNAKCILTPRFVPSTTSELMNGIAKIAEEYNMRIQSHLNENKNEIEWVKNLHPQSSSFAECYNMHRLFRKNKTIMAHCVYNTDAENELLKKYGVYVAHSPLSNLNLSSGIMPLRKYMNYGLKIGLASDVSGGNSLNMCDVITSAIQSSKMYEMMNPEYKQINFAEGFYLATAGSGEFFGKVGKFDKGYEFDALVINDSEIINTSRNSLSERLERFVYKGNNNMIIARYIGSEI